MVVGIGTWIMEKFCIIETKLSRRHLKAISKAGKWNLPTPPFVYFVAWTHKRMILNDVSAYALTYTNNKKCQ